MRREPAVAALDSAGADLVLADSEELTDRVRKEIGDSPLPLALDAIGGSSCLRLADCLSKGGKLVNYGFLSGDPCMITPLQTIVSSITLHGFSLANNLFQESRQKVEMPYSEITELILAGTISAPVEATYKLEQVQQALSHGGRGGRSGKILFSPNLEYGN